MLNWREMGEQRGEATMSDEHDTHGHGAHPSSGHGAALPFSEAEIREFRQSDVAGGGAVVVLMAAIFSVGLVLYGVIAYVTYLR
jgi:hypothetical protein